MAGGCALTPRFEAHAATGASSGADVLRLERFGALYYRRQTFSHHALDHGTAELLLEARDRSLIEVLARRGSVTPEAQLEQAVLLAELRRNGLLDEQFRCQARVVDVDRGHAALAAPMVTHIQLTRACNLHCSHCYADVTPKRGPEELTVEELHRLFRELSGMGSHLVVLAGGEPLVRQDLFEVLAGVREHDLDAWLCTNGTMIDASKADRLAKAGLRGFSISLDGPDASSHEIIRGKGRFASTVRGVRHLVDAGASDVQLRVTVTPHNVGRMLEFAEVGRKLGVHRICFKVFRKSGAASGAQELELGRDEFLAAAKLAEASWPADACPAEFEEGMPTRLPDWTRVIPDFGCVGGTTSASVLHDGRVLACGSVSSPGAWNLRDRGFAECWRRSPVMDEWRSLAGNDQCRSCENFRRCGGGCRTRALAEGGSLNDPDPWARCSQQKVPSRSRLRVVA